MRHVDEAEGMLRGIDGPISELVQLKLDAFLRKNEGLDAETDFGCAFWQSNDATNRL